MPDGGVAPAFGRGARRPSYMWDSLLSSNNELSDQMASTLGRESDHVSAVDPEYAGVADQMRQRAAAEGTDPSRFVVQISSNSA